MPFESSKVLRPLWCVLCRYDINKDRWDMLISRLPFSDLKHLVLSDRNVNVLFMIGLNRDRQYELHSFDMRDGNDRTEKIIADMMPPEVWMSNPKMQGLPHRPAKQDAFLKDFSCVVNI